MRLPNALFKITTPSVADEPPGNCAYPKIPLPIVATQRFNFVVGEVGFIPPCVDFLHASLVPQDVFVVDFL